MRQIVTKHWEGTSLEIKPTGVIAGTTFRETDTNAMYITYDGTVWIVADKRVRLVEEDGTFIDLPQEFATLVLALKQSLEASIDVGEATGGSGTTLVDSTKSWETDMWLGSTYDVEIAGKGYLGLVISNTQTELTFAALAGGAVVVAGCPYALKRLVSVSDIGAWGGTNLTGRDISLDLAKIDNLLTGFEAKSNYGSSTGAALTVDLDTAAYGGRLFVEIWVKSSATATFTIYGSRDNSNWREVDEIVLSGVGEDHKGFDNAYRYIRVATTDANNNEAEIVASR